MDNGVDKEAPARRCERGMMKSDLVHTMLPRDEMERRHALLRAHMADRGLDALVVLSSDDYLGGYIRWILDRPAYHGYHAAAAFYADGSITLAEHGSIGGEREPDNDPEFPGVTKILHAAAFRSVRYTHDAEAALIVGDLRKHGARRVGLIGGGAMPHAFVAAIIADVAEITDETEFVDMAKAIKSSEEIAEIKATAAMQDVVFKHLLENVRPGMVERELMGIAQAEGRRLGSENGVYMIASAPPGTPTFLRFPRWQGRTIAKGDQVTLLIENNGPGGFYTELARTMVLGQAPTDLLDATAAAVAAQRATLDLLRPGARCADIARVHDDYLAARGQPPERRLYSHGQGYDLVERPLIRADETMTIEQGMNIVVHPGFLSPNSFGFVCDNYIIGAEGPGNCIHKTDKKIFEVAV